VRVLEVERLTCEERDRDLPPRPVKEPQALAATPVRGSCERSLTSVAVTAGALATFVAGASGEAACVAAPGAACGRRRASGVGGCCREALSPCSAAGVGAPALLLAEASQWFVAAMGWA
jgi:hypothetical protein